MKKILFTDNKKDNFKGFDIVAHECLFIDLDDNKKKKYVEWDIMKDGKIYLHDFRTIDGSDLNNVSHAINDAKKNITTLIRLTPH